MISFDQVDDSRAVADIEIYLRSFELMENLREWIAARCDGWCGLPAANDDVM